jgi:ketosteroid isomerase-like protein
MTRSLTVGAFALSLFSLLLFPRSHNAVRVGTGGAQTQHSDTESLTQIEKDLFKVKMTRDPDVIGKVVADDWVNLEPDRRGPGKAEMIEFLRQHSGQLPPSSFQQHDLQVFIFGNTAVATYVQGDTAQPDGQPMDVTDVFVKDDGTWKLRLTRGSLHFQHY